METHEMGATLTAPPQSNLLFNDGGEDTKFSESIIKIALELLKEEERDEHTLIQDLKERAGVGFTAADKAIEKAIERGIIIKGNDRICRIGDTTATQTPDTNNVSEIAKEAPAPQPLEKSGFLEGLKADCKRLENTRQVGMLIYCTANQCMQEELPDPRDLYPPLPGLIYEGEITLLFGNTGIGKSAAAVQIACSIAQTDKVLYYDFELSRRQFQRRYSDAGKNKYKFPDKLIRVYFARPLNIPNGKNFNDYIIECIRDGADQMGAKILVIDNMTMLATGDMDKAKEAKPLMDKLVELKFERDLTLILLEHTRKGDESRPASLNDLQGSKMKVNFADAVFYIGKSAKDTNLRYIKQMKCRSSEIRYDADNVAVFELVKENSFLQFKIVGFDKESNHLREVSDDDKKKRKQEAVELKKQGMSNREIAKQLGVSHTAVGNWLDKR